MEMEEHLKAAEIIATMLDNRFVVGGMRFGLGAFIELIPEIGDILILFLSFYLVWIGIKMKIPSFALAQMIANIMFITAVGTIPIAGDVVYILYRANIRNLEILRRFMPQKIVGEEIIPRQFTGTSEGPQLS